MSYDHYVSRTEAKAEVNLSLRKAAAGAVVTTAGIIWEHTLDLPEKAETILVGGGAGLALVGLYETVKAYQVLRESNRYR